MTIAIIWLSVFGLVVFVRGLVWNELSTTVVGFLLMSPEFLRECFHRGGAGS